MNLEIYRRVLAGDALTFPLSPRALWRLTGPDRERYLNGQVTCDVTKLPPSQAAYAAVCTAKGRMEGDLFIGRHEAEFYLDADAELRESLGERLEKYLIADDAAFEDISDFWSLSHVFGVTPPEAPETSFFVANARFGVPGHDLWVPSSGSILMGDLVGTDVVETLRIEHALPRWGAELSANTLPPEAGPAMLDAISYTKGCYVGQETIARLKSVGHVNRTLVLLRSEKAEFPAVGSKLTHGELDSGAVTSAGFSPRLERGIALAYVPLRFAAEGTILRTGDLTLTIVAPLHK